ncbi:hypothetical protein SDC9_107721 [bioreactor metagenome]|uniref:Uncharacterized protein n=1 Tax=bioreactor metagenome TaxID=1076179 RepID=A0A645B633_9ZZZZ
MVAQRVAGQQRAGVGLDDDVVAIDLQREPFGGGRGAFGGVLQQQRCGGVHTFQARRQRADLRIQRGEAAGLVGLVLDLAAQRLGNGAQRCEKAFSVVGDLRERLHQLGRQHAAGHARTRDVVVGRGVARRAIAEAARALLGRLELLAIDVHHQPRHILQRGA